MAEAVFSLRIPLRTSVVVINNLSRESQVSNVSLLMFEEASKRRRISSFYLSSIYISPGHQCLLPALSFSPLNGKKE